MPKKQTVCTHCKKRGKNAPALGRSGDLDEILDAQAWHLHQKPARDCENPFTGPVEISKLRNEISDTVAGLHGVMSEHFTEFPHEWDSIKPTLLPQFTALMETRYPYMPQRCSLCICTRILADVAPQDLDDWD